MPQTGPRRQNVAVRLLENELSLVREIGRTSETSISDLLRDLMSFPPSDKVLARRSTSELRRDLITHAAGDPFAYTLWAAAIHRVLETRSPATVDEFLQLYASRVGVLPTWAPDGAHRTVAVGDDLEIAVGYGGPEPMLRLAPRIPSRNRSLPTALLRGAELPTVAAMRDLLDDTARRARRLAAEV
jgi:hypothetical protein